MTTALDDLAAEYAQLRQRSEELRRELEPVRHRITEVRPQLFDAIAEAIRAGTHRQVDISKKTGLTGERIRRICRERGVESDR